LAQTTARSAIGLLVIQVLAPVSRSRRHLVGAGDHASGVGAGPGLGQAEAADQFAGRQLGQVFAALVLAAVGEDRMHHERGLHAHRRAVAAVDALDLAGDQAVGDVVGLGPAIGLRQRRPEQAQGAHLAHDGAVEGLVAVGLAHPRLELGLAILAGRVADRAFLARELVLQPEGVSPVETWAHG
jgi:hypothetical protein